MTLKVLLISTLSFLVISCEEESMITGNGNKFIKEASEDDSSAAPGDLSIAEIAINDGEFGELVAALSYVDNELNAGLVDLFLYGTDQYTVFAPHNKAFEDLYRGLGINDITDLPADLVLDLLLYHVAEGRRALYNVVPESGTLTLETQLGKTISVSSIGNITDKLGNNVTILKADVSATNGIIHVIDVVMHPFGKDVVSDAVIKKASDTNNSNILYTGLSIAEVAVGAGFTELVKALTYVDNELGARLVNLFQNGTDQYTVFAPTNAAFYSLYASLGVEEITDLAPELVRDVIFYHIANGRLISNEVVPGKGDIMIESLLGSAFTVNNVGLITAIGNTSLIISTDISASNGIIHVIDSVILPIE